jgi:hypothetical protein
MRILSTIREHFVTPETSIRLREVQYAGPYVSACEAGIFGYDNTCKQITQGELT